MLIDASAPRNWNEYEFTIVGSGFAGLFLAEKLAKLGKVLVIEAGTLEDPLAFGTGYYEVEASGLPMPNMGMRLSAFGGTSNHWTGQCRPFSPRIFRNREWVGIAGWPIRYQDFAAHLGEAQAWLNLPERFDGVTDAEMPGGLLSDHRNLTADRFFTPDPLFTLSEPQFRDRFIAHEGIDLLLGVRVTDLVLDPSGQRVTDVEAVTADRNAFSISVRRLLLCAGGIENARLLLWSGRKYGPGNPLLGGPNELTGKYYTEHPVYWPIEMFCDHRIDLSVGLPTLRDGALQHVAWRPDDAFLERHGLPRFAALLNDDGLWPTEGDGPNTGDQPWLRRPAGFKVTVPALKFEQTPHERSRIMLSDRRDRDGTPIARVHWEILPKDIAAYRKATLLFCGLLSQGGLIRTRLRSAYRMQDWTTIVPGISSHCIGTTRMAHAPTAGVVDTDCRVFGTENLFVAGSSVFPHGDYLNPTLNFLALAARLAATMTIANGGYGRSFRFGEERPENRYLVEGWSHAENLGIWSDGHRARIVVPAAGARRLRMRGHAYRDVELTLTVNGKQVFCGPGQNIVRFQCDIESHPECEIVLSFSSPQSPVTYGENDDERKLGYFIKSVDLS